MSQIFTEVRTMLASYTETTIEEFDMSEDLDRGYDMDSTELTEIARLLSERFGITVAKSERTDWKTGNDIASFVNRAAHGAEPQAAVAS